MKRGQLESNLLVLVTLALVAFGLVMVYSATSATAAVGGGQPITYLTRQGIYTAVGLGALLLLSRASYRALRRLAPTLLAASVVLLAGVLVLGDPVNGARRWLGAGPVTFQPSELAKLTLVLWAAAQLSRRPAPRTLRELWRPLGAVFVVVCTLLVLEPDLGTTIAVGIAAGTLLLVSGSPVRLLARAGVLGAGLVVAAIWLEPYRRARIFGFLDPWDDAQGAGFQSVQAMIGLGSGGLFGVGLGEGVQKVFYLPEAHTDMIFAIVGEEMGLIGSTAVILAYAAFAYAGLRIALLARDPFAKRLAAGLTVLVCGQAALNLAAVVGVAPLTGITLPFVSYGGTSVIVSLASVGILLNIARSDGERATARVPDRGRGDRRPRAAGAGGGGGADRPGCPGDLRRVGGPRRVAARP